MSEPRDIVRADRRYWFGHFGKRRRKKVVCRTCQAIVHDAYHHAVWHATEGHEPKFGLCLSLYDECIELHTAPRGVS